MNTIADSQKHIFNSNNSTPNMVKIDKQFMPLFIIIISWTITLITASQSDPIPSSASQVFKMIYRLYTENTDTCRLLGQQHNRSVYHTCLMITKYNHHSGVNFFALSCVCVIVVNIVKMFIENLLDVRNTRRFNNWFLFVVIYIETTVVTMFDVWILSKIRQ